MTLADLCRYATIHSGCDSIVTLDLTINESYDDVVDTLYRCVGDSALLAGSYQTVSGVYVDTLQSASGCDSIVSTTLIVDTDIVGDTLELVLWRQCRVEWSDV